MPPALPTSLSPHICILTSPDLAELLDSTALPPLPHILQSFSPLPQVTTRTTSLSPVPHESFVLRFSDLQEIEAACREDEEQRAGRTIDWISARVSQRCSKWVDDWENTGPPAAEKEADMKYRTPWWEELKRCVHGDHIPSTVEGWNHPVSIILAVSTMAPNPLQALAQLHTRPPDLPSWVDSARLVYTLIVHPKNSALSDEEAGALFNAVKKQYGLHSYLLPLTVPSPPPPPVPVPALLPRLPSPPLPQGSPDPSSAAANNPATRPPADVEVTLNTLRMNDPDIQQTARFVREFVTMSLVPWMEKCVNDWNENFSSNRRLPSRLFSSTRRLFGTGATSALSPTISTPIRSHSVSSSQTFSTGFPTPVDRISQQQRLAEFATVLGDIKLATTVWEALRKDGKGGSETLPFLLAPSPAIQLHVTHALNTIRTPQSELSALVQLRTMVYAVRWESCISMSDFLGNVLEGDKWLVWAAGSAEEPPSALLYGHAALLSVRKNARRRAALWYLFAANKLEKYGIKPLTMYFLRRAHDLYGPSPEKDLSPSFWDSEGVEQHASGGFDAILPGIEHALGRLHYTTGNVEAAVQFFLKLLRGSSEPADRAALLSLTNGNIADGSKAMGSDKVFLEDFRVALQHLQDTADQKIDLTRMKLPVKFSVPSQTRLRLSGDSVGGDEALWEVQEETWRAFWKPRGKETLRSASKAAVDETFWVDVTLRNPMDVDVNLSNLTVVLRDKLAEDEDLGPDVVEVEVVDDLVLSAKEIRTIPLFLRAKKPLTLLVTHVSFDFLSLLPTIEPLASRGRRLQDTPLQRQSKMYAPDVMIKTEIEDASQRLLVNFVDDGQLVLAHGECHEMRLWLSNVGTKSIGEMWLVEGPEDELWIEKPNSPSSDSAQDVIHSCNSLTSRPPQQIILEEFHDSPSLSPGSNFQLSMKLHAGKVGEQELCLMLIYREKEEQFFRAARVTRPYIVQPLLSVTKSSKPGFGKDHAFLLDVEVANVSENADVVVSQVMTMSPLWKCQATSEPVLDTLIPNQALHIPMDVDPWDKAAPMTPFIDFVSSQLKCVLNGQNLEPLDPPPIDVLCCPVTSTTSYSSLDPSTSMLLHQARRSTVAQSLATSHPYIAPHLHQSIFPLYNPHSIDVVLFWSLPSEHRSGHVLLSGASIGARHAALKEIVEEAEVAKVKRSMYAETQREKGAILEAIRNSEWNAEMNPLMVAFSDGQLIQHDFSKGPCHAPVPVVLKNCSFTHTSRYTLKLAGKTKSAYPPELLLQPFYMGRLTYRGTLKPLQSVTVTPTLYVHRPDTYRLGGWNLESEVLENGPEARTRFRYSQGPPENEQLSLTVTGVHVASPP